MRHLRILLVSSAYYPYISGVSVHVENLARGLANLGHKITILTTRYHMRKEKRSKMKEDSGARIADSGERNIVRFGKAIFLRANQSVVTLPIGLRLNLQVRNFLNNKNKNFDIIHLHGIYPPEIGFWALHYSKSINIVTFHSASFNRLFVVRKFLKNLFKKYLKKLNGRIAVSKMTRDWIRSYFPGEYRIIPNGIDLKKFTNTQKSLPELSVNKPVIIFVGRMVKRKGFPVLLQAFRKLKEKFPMSILFAVGDGPMLKLYKTIVSDFGLSSSVQFYGSVSQDALAQLYRSSTVFCAPSQEGEAQGIVLLEAMASGVPVIASKIKAYQELIKDGENGLLFLLDDSAHLAHLLSQLLKTPALQKHLKENGYKTALDYSWEKIVKKVIDYYQELLDNFYSDETRSVH